MGNKITSANIPVATPTDLLPGTGLMPVILSGDTIGHSTTVASLRTLGPVTRYTTSGAAVPYSTLPLALAATVAGDTLVLAAGTFDMGANKIGQLPNSVSIVGQGRYSSIITGSYNVTTGSPTAISFLCPGHSSNFHDFAILINNTFVTPTNVTIAFGCDAGASGTPDTIPHNVTATGLLITSARDGIYASKGSAVVDTGAVWKFYDCDVVTQFDCTNIIQSGTSTTWDITFELHGGNLTSLAGGNNRNRALCTTSGGNILAIGTTINVFGSASQTSSSASEAIYAGGTSTIKFAACNISVSTLSGVTPHTLRPAGGTITDLDGNSYDRSKVFTQNSTVMKIVGAGPFLVTTDPLGSIAAGRPLASLPYERRYYDGSQGGVAGFYICTDPSVPTWINAPTLDDVTGGETAGALYTGTEQAMLQRCYDALFPGT